jgi:ArpU family phage transcriptional regulator
MDKGGMNVEQLNFIDTSIPKEAKRKAQKLMSRYRMLDAIIESRQLKTNKMTVNYDASESQRGNQFHSQTEELAMNEIQLEEYVLTKKKLDLIFDSLKPDQQKIWEQRYMLGMYDTDVFLNLGIPHRTYYRLKKEMIAVVAEGMGLV